MPYRKTPLRNGYYYHIYNRGLNRQITFSSPKFYQRAMEALWYYRFQHTPMSLHLFLALPKHIKDTTIEKLESNDERHIDVVSYCLMPNHYHLILRQLTDNGISKFVGDFQNSYTRYFNIRKGLQGALFVPQFKAVLIETDEQLIHVNRYSHLNPYTSAVVNSIDETINYPYSSFAGFTGKRKDKIITGFNLILSNFSSIKAYEKFVSDHSSYQKELHKIKHLVMES